MGGILSSKTWPSVLSKNAKLVSEFVQQDQGLNIVLIM